MDHAEIVDVIPVIGDKQAELVLVRIDFQGFFRQVKPKFQAPGVLLCYRTYIPVTSRIKANKDKVSYKTVCHFLVYLFLNMALLKLGFCSSKTKTKLRYLLCTIHGQKYMDNCI